MPTAALFSPIQFCLVRHGPPISLNAPNFCCSPKQHANHIPAPTRQEAQAQGPGIGFWGWVGAAKNQSTVPPRLLRPVALHLLLALKDYLWQLSSKRKRNRACPVPLPIQRSTASSRLRARDDVTDSDEPQQLRLCQRSPLLPRRGFRRAVRTSHRSPPPASRRFRLPIS